MTKKAQNKKFGIKKFKKLHENCDAMEAALYTILNYPEEWHSKRTNDGYPSEIVYDELAYKRLVNLYRYAAKIGLGIEIK